MFSLKKTSALLCSAAALAVFGAAAFSANAFDTVDLDDRASELTAGKVNVVADQVYAEPGETVDFRVMLSGNTGYADCGIGLVYDPQLTLKLAEDGEPDLKTGDAARGLRTEYTLNDQKNRIAFSSMGQSNNKDSGMLYTVQFKVPEDARENDEYALTVDIVHLLDKDTAAVASAAVNGWIKVRVPVVTTTAAPVPATTTVITTTTAPVTEPPVVTTVTTPEPVIVTTPDTTPAPPDTTPEPVTVTTPDTTEPVTEPITKKTTRDINPNNQATTAQGGTKPAVQGVKTGDVGSGAAAAGLLLAVTTAALVAPKRKDQ